jgi:L-threonylcarbamoyladenylate synthase
MTKVIRVDAAQPEPAAIEAAAERLRAGDLVAFPTETVYGLGVHALNPAAVRRLFAAKGRPATDPLIVHVTSLEAAVPLVAGLPDDAHRLSERFWPGPLTLVMRRSSAVPDEVTAGLETVAIRAPAHPVARALLAAARVPVAAPSANLFSRPSPTHASHVLDDLDGLIDLVLDAGSTAVGVESTVLDLMSDPPVVLRPGAITPEMLRGVLPRVRIFAQAAPAPDLPKPSPGMLERHYSPRAPLTLYEGQRDAAIAGLIRDATGARALGHAVGILTTTEDRHRMPVGEPGFLLIELGSSADMATVASRLFAALRELDAAGVDVILARGFPTEEGLGLAVQDRLRRAAAGRIVNADEREAIPRRSGRGE